MNISELPEIVEKYNRKGYKLFNIGQLKSGKEAVIYAAGTDVGKVALKIYKDPALRRFQKDHEYLEGKYYRNSSVRRAVTNRTKMGRDLLFRTWVRREYYMLNKLGRKQANVPKVYGWFENSVLMEFIGEDISAPQLLDVTLSREQAKKALEIILKNVELFLECGIVHSDLSEYNILWWKEQPYIIDFPQAIDIRNNPNKDAFLKRDLDNVIDYFGKFIKINKTAIYKKFEINSDNKE